MLTILKSRFTNVGVIQNSYVSEAKIGLFMEEICDTIYELKKGK